MGEPGRLRIVHLADNYPPSLGGLERTVQSLSRVQVAAGHDVAVVSTELAGEPALAVDAGVSVHRLPFALQRVPGAFQDPRRVFFPPVPEPQFQHHLGRVLQVFRPDVVHVHGWVLYSGIGPARRAGAAVVATAHDYGSVCAVKTLFRDGAICSGPGLVKCLRCATATYGIKAPPIVAGMHLASVRHRQVDEWIAISSTVARAGSAPLARDRREMVVVPSFVPDSVVEMSTEVPRPDFVPPRRPYLFFAGALGTHKGVDVLLQAHRVLVDAGVDVDLVLAGMASPGKTVDTDRPGVTTALAVPHDAVMAGWANAAVGVVPSRWGEPFGQVAVECLAAGTPLVATRVGGLVDIVEDGRSGLLVEPGDPVALAAAIRRILDDPALAASLVAAGRRRAPLFTASAVQVAVERSYRRAIAHRAARTGEV